MDNGGAPNGPHSDAQLDKESSLAPLSGLYRALFARGADATFIVAASGQILDANEKASESLGYTVAELRTLAIPDIDSHWSGASIDAGVAVHLEDRKLIHVTGRHRRKDGSEFDVEVRVQLFEHEGETRFIAVARDLTEIQAYREELRRKEAQLAEARRLESFGLYAGGVMHDLSNVLTPILMEAEVLQRELQGEVYEEALNMILEASRLARDLVLRLLAFSGRKQVTIEPTDLSATLRSLEALLRSLTRTEIELEIQVPRRPVVVSADPSRVAQAVLNLAVNAQGAIDGPGRIRVSLDACRRIETSVRLQGGHLAAGWYAVIRVEDDGPGISRDVIGLLFDPLFTTKLSRGGLGLGTVQDIMREHSGGAHVDSQPGQGTIFELFFPNELSLGPGQGPKGRLRLVSDPPSSVLVVDDNEGVRVSLARCLEGLGYQVWRAVDGPDALRQLEQMAFEVDLVLTGSKLPGCGGEALLEASRAAGARTAYIFMSTDPLPPGAPRSLYGYPVLAKPFSLADLESAVRATLRLE